MTEIPDDVKFGEEDKYGIGVDLYCEMGKITPKEIWDTKDYWFQFAENSRKEWEKMDDEHREALIRMVKAAMERMHDRVADWVPEAMAVEGGNFLDVHIKILFTDIDKEIERNEQATSFQIAAAEEELRNTLPIVEEEAA